MWFKILSSRNNNPPTLPPLTQGLQPLHVRVFLSSSALVNAALLLLYHLENSRPKGSVLWKGTFLGQERWDFSFSFPQQKTKLHSSCTLTPLLPTSGEKQTNKKMYFPSKCSKITQLLASHTGCRAPQPDCIRGKARSRHESEPVQTRRWTRTNFTLRYHPGHQIEAHNCATQERLMQAGTGFNEHWVSLRVLQKRNSQRSCQHITNTEPTQPRRKPDTAKRGLQEGEIRYDTKQHVLAVVRVAQSEKSGLEGCSSYKHGATPTCQIYVAATRRTGDQRGS